MAKVGIVTDVFAPNGVIFDGGAERQTLQLARLASDLGADVTVYQSAARSSLQEAEGVRVQSLATSRKQIWLKGTQQAIIDGCRHLHYLYLGDVPALARRVHATATHHGIYWDIPFEKEFADWYPYRSLARVYLGPWRRLQKARYFSGLRRCQEVISADSSLLRIVQSDVPNLRNRVSVIPNFFDLSPNGSPSALPPVIEAARAAGRSVILVPRNLSLTKGILWLASLTEVVSTRTGGRCQFIVTGDFPRQIGHWRHYQKQLNSSLTAMAPEARSRITFLSGVQHRDMGCYYSAADVVLIPTFAFEATSIAAIEAMAFGKPVLGTNVGGLNDILDDNVTGMLVKPLLADLAEGILCLLADDDLRLRLGQEAQRKARSRYSLDVWRSNVTRFIVRNGWLTDEPALRSQHSNGAKS
jgi:glycosyltransferase involved in cell wall biosynthesis